MIDRLYELVTGRPWLTVRSMADEFGPPPAVHFAAELAGRSDADLIHGPQRRAPRARTTEDCDAGTVPASR